MASLMKVMTFLEVLFLSVALSGMFPQEAQHRTDQLILSSRRGRTALYTGKLLAGLTVGVGFGLLLLATLLGVTGLVYGLEGFGVSALFTLLMPLGASIGQVTLILFGAFLAAAAVTSLAAMVLSQVTRNSVATMGILVGILLLTTLITAVPESPRLLSVLWYLLPSNFVSLQGAFRYDLLSVGGLSLTTWQVTPVVYLLLTALLALGGTAFIPPVPGGRPVKNSKRGKGTSSFAAFAVMGLQRPLALVCMEQVMGGLRQGMAQVFLVEGLDGGIFMGEADGALLVQGVQTLPSLGGVVLPVVDGLTAAAGTSAGTGHDLYKIVGDLSGPEGVHQSPGTAQAGGHRQAEGGLPNGEGGLPPGLLPPDVLKGIGRGIGAGELPIGGAEGGLHHPAGDPKDHPGARPPAQGTVKVLLRQGEPR